MKLKNRLFKIHKKNGRKAHEAIHRLLAFQLITPTELKKIAKRYEKKWDEPASAYYDFNEIVEVKPGIFTETIQISEGVALRGNNK